GVLDMNRLGQRGATALGWNGGVYAARARAFGWHAIELNGHDLQAIDAAYAEALGQKDRPTLLVAKTEKGSGGSFVANKDGWHGKALDAEQARKASEELGGEPHVKVPTLKPEPRPGHDSPPTIAPVELPVWDVGTKEATRKAYGSTLVALGRARADLVVLD